MHIATDVKKCLSKTKFMFSVIYVGI